MGRYVIEVDDETVKNQMTKILTDILMEEMRYAHSDITNLMTAFVENVVYSHKDVIIERVINVAAKEIVWEGLPRFLEACYEISERENEVNRCPNCGAKMKGGERDKDDS